MGYYEGPYHYGIHLPHYDQAHLLHMITYRLGDSLPGNILKQLEAEVACLPLKEQDVERRKRVEYWQDQGVGSCLLKYPDCARHVRDVWEFHNGKHYHLGAWVIMPNHVHLLVEVNETAKLEMIIRVWKTFSCRLINRSIRRQGALWMPDYFDRYIRNGRHFSNALSYLRRNVRQGGVLWYLPEEGALTCER